MKNGTGVNHSLIMNSTNSPAPPASKPQNRLDSNQSSRLPCNSPVASMQIAGAPSSTPPQLNVLKRSRRSGSWGMPWAMAIMATTQA